MPESIEGMGLLRMRLAQLATDIKRTEKPLRAAGSVLVASITKNFQAQGRPEKWKPLAASTIEQRRKGRGKGGPQILIDSGRLRNSIAYKLVSGGVTVGTNVVYARRQHFGYPMGGVGPVTPGRGHSHTPARPFMIMQPEDVTTIDKIFVKHVSGGKAV